MIVDIFAQDFFANSNSESTPDMNLREFRGFACFRRNLDEQAKSTQKLEESPLQVFRFAKYRQN